MGVTPPSTAAVPPHEGVTSDRVDHFHEGQGSHCDLAGAQCLEARLLVEGNQEVLAHEHGAAHVGEAAQVLQVAPHQDGAFALLAERPMHGQHVDVDGVAVRLVEGQRILVGKQKRTRLFSARRGNDSDRKWLKKQGKNENEISTC